MRRRMDVTRIGEGFSSEQCRFKPDGILREGFLTQKHVDREQLGQATQAAE